MAKTKNQITATKYDIVTIEIETAMLTPPGYQHRQNNKQTKTNILYTLKTNKTKQKKIFFSGFVYRTKVIQFRCKN